MSSFSLKLGRILKLGESIEYFVRNFVWEKTYTKSANKLVPYPF